MDESWCVWVQCVVLFWWKVLELQQQLKSTQHQLRVEAARAGESSRLERDSRDLSDTLASLRAQQQEEHITRWPTWQWQILVCSLRGCLQFIFNLFFSQEAVGAAGRGAAAAGALSEAEGGLSEQDQHRAQPQCPTTGHTSVHPGGGA